MTYDPLAAGVADLPAVAVGEAGVGGGRALLAAAAGGGRGNGGEGGDGGEETHVEGWFGVFWWAGKRVACGCESWMLMLMLETGERRCDADDENKTC